MRTLPSNAKIYVPEDESQVKGTLQIIHGMAEHQGRYADFANFLKDHGYAVATSDLRGHGNNVQREEELGYFGDNAVDNLVNDAHEITLYLKERFSSVPCMLLGHSMGTMISTVYFKKYNAFIDALFLSGIPGKNNAANLGIAITKVIQSGKGEYYKSEFLDNVLNGPFRKPFKKENSKVSWICSDPAVWKAYEEDPKCGFLFTVNGYRTVLDLMQYTTTNKMTWIKKRMDIPIRFMSGQFDPCMGGFSKLKGAAAMFRKEGYTDVTYVTYDGMRHEILNDFKKDEVYNYILTEMDKVSENKKNP
mgnify:CR=1 FL=1